MLCIHNFVHRTMQIESPLLELRDIVFSYTESNGKFKNKPLLEIDKLILRPGDRVGVVGDNGSGKSTIVRFILGLQTPKGTVNLFGKRASWGNHYPQLGYIGDPSLCPGETGLPTGVLVGELIDGFKAICSLEERDYRDFEEGLGLNKFLGKSVSNLSNGERKKLMIFLALTKRPRLLIADEATDGLDDSSKAFVIKKLEMLLESSMLSLLWISHQYYEVARLTDTVYKLTDGKLVSADQKRFDCEIYTFPQESFCGTYKNLSSKGWLEIVSKIYGSPEISRFDIKGERSH